MSFDNIVVESRGHGQKAGRPCFARTARPLEGGVQRAAEEMVARYILRLAALMHEGSPLGIPRHASKRAKSVVTNGGSTAAYSDFSV